jgi:heme-degrading monooxygenase HmoA
VIAVIFEVEPAEGQRHRYLDIAAELRPQLDGIDGFISVERFQSLSQPGKLVSLSFFTSEDAVQQWRLTAEHRAAQKAGRSGVFSNYRLRVASVIRDYGLKVREEAPADLRGD